jgi:pyruvate ferredoxin oxidoreductase alpha subunit
MYGMEALVVTATDRLPPLFLVGNRALDDPGAFGVEHNDALSIRDMGWLLAWASSAQEALEHVLIGYRIAEDQRVRMPMALALDGAFLTHSEHMVKIPTKEAVEKFLPLYDPGTHRLHPDNPVSIAPQINEDWVMELRRQNWEAARRARGIIAEAYQEFNAIFGTEYKSPYFSAYECEDAEVILLGLGAVCMPARTAMKRLREKGKKVGYLNLRWFRPFPTEELRAAIGHAKGVGVIDRDFAHGSPDNGGIVVHDVRSALYPLKDRPAITNFIGGLGGRDLSIDDCIKMFETTYDAAAGKKEDGDLVTWIGLRE